MSNTYVQSVPVTPHKDPVILDGRFRFNGSSAPTSVVGYGIASVAHTSTGVWTVTLNSDLNTFQGFYTAHATLMLDASALSFVTLGKFDVSAGTIIVRAYTEAAGTLALADIAAGSNDGNWCNLHMSCKESVAPDGSGL